MPALDPLTLIAFAPAGADLADWRRELESHGIPFQILPVVDAADPGAALRSALPDAEHPVVGLLQLDYPYRPGDLLRLRQRLADIPEGMDRPLDFVCGVRTGRAAPKALAAAGGAVRLFARAALGLPLEPAPAWGGWREASRSWLAAALFANPFHDPMCGLKLIRRSVFDKFPVQCDGDAVHLELIAKATFLTCLLDEVPLTPDPAPIPRTSWRGVGRLLRDPQFTPQHGPADAAPAPPPEPIEVPSPV